MPGSSEADTVNIEIYPCIAVSQVPTEVMEEHEEKPVEFEDQTLKEVDMELIINIDAPPLSALQFKPLTNQIHSSAFKMFSISKKASGSGHGYKDQGSIHVGASQRIIKGDNCLFHIISYLMASTEAHYGRFCQVHSGYIENEANYNRLRSFLH